MRALKNIYHLLSLAGLSVLYALRPKNVELTFKFADHLIGLGAYRDCEIALNAEPQAMALIRARAQIHSITLHDLLKFPEGSLGQVYARHMLDAGLQPDFYPSIAIQADAHYVLQRLRSIHDVVHVVTGYDTTEDGEIGLQSFLMGQLHWPFAMLIVGGTIFAAPFQRRKHDFGRRMQIIMEGWQMGVNARLLFAYDWNQAWSRPLSRVRDELGVSPSRLFDARHSSNLPQTKSSTTDARPRARPNRNQVPRTEAALDS